MNLNKLKKEQISLAKKIVTRDSIKKIKVIGGCDQAFLNDKTISAIIILDNNFKIIEKTYAITKQTFPYIPGFLSYREVPPIIKAYKKSKHKPNVLLCDFNGQLHPRFLGAASHLGVLLNICTIGVAKSLLCGEIKNNYIYVKNKKIGYKLKQKDYKPIYISPGHKISLQTSIKIVKKLIKNHRLPEPLRLAHLYANEIKNSNIYKAP